MSACTLCVFYPQLKCSYKRKDNDVIHLLAARKECVSSQSSCPPLLGFEFLLVDLHISDRTYL